MKGPIGFLIVGLFFGLIVNKMEKVAGKNQQSIKRQGENMDRDTKDFIYGAGGFAIGFMVWCVLWLIILDVFS